MIFFESLIAQGTCRAADDGVGNSTDLVAGAALPFDDHFGDSYSRVQRIRAKKAQVWMKAKLTLPVLITSSLVLAPLESVMS